MKEADGWTCIPTSFGRGKDSYARRGDNGGPFGTQPIIIVKHTDIETPGAHEWPVWRRNLAAFTPLLFQTTTGR